MRKKSLNIIYHLLAVNCISKRAQNFMAKLLCKIALLLCRRFFVLSHYVIDTLKFHIITVLQVFIRISFVSKQLDNILLSIFILAVLYFPYFAFAILVIFSKKKKINCTVLLYFSFYVCAILSMTAYKPNFKDDVYSLL